MYSAEGEPRRKPHRIAPVRMGSGLHIFQNPTGHYTGSTATRRLAPPCHFGRANSAVSEVK